MLTPVAGLIMVSGTKGETMTLEQAVKDGKITMQDAYRCIAEIDEAINANEPTEAVKAIFRRYVG